MCILLDLPPTSHLFLFKGDEETKQTNFFRKNNLDTQMIHIFGNLVREVEKSCVRVNPCASWAMDAIDAMVFPTEDASFGGQKALLGLRRCECASESESGSGRRRCRRKCWELD